VEYQSLSAGFMDLSARFQKAQSNLKGRILVSDAAHGLSADATSELLAVAVNSTPCAAAVDSGYDPAL